VDDRVRRRTLVQGSAEGRNEVLPEQSTSPRAGSPHGACLPKCPVAERRSGRDFSASWLCVTVKTSSTLARNGRLSPL
jgi:hypothetical protein